MKMKNMLIGGMSLALVACISIGGTLALYTKTTQRVKNVFTASTGIAMTLDEAYVEVDPKTGLYVKDADNNSRKNDNAYTDLIPGMHFKDPTVHVTTVPSVGMKLYVLVEGLDKDLDADGYEVTPDSLFAAYPAAKKVATVTGDPVPAEDQTKDGIYYVGTITQSELTSGKKDVVVFNNVTFEYKTETVAPAIDNIYVLAYGIQANIDEATANQGAEDALVAGLAAAKEE